MIFFIPKNISTNILLNRINKEIHIESGYTTQVSPSIIRIHASIQRMRPNRGVCGFTRTLMVTKSPYIHPHPFRFPLLNVICIQLTAPVAPSDYERI